MSTTLDTLDTSSRPRVKVTLGAHVGPVGLSVAAFVLTCWATSLGILLFAPLPDGVLPFAPLLVALQTFFYTGLFITAHDAMHGTVFPPSPRLNDAVGTLATLLYALFSFTKLRSAHWLHHDHVATDEDPDFHDGEHTSFARWYLTFLWRYVGGWQIVGMAIVFNVLAHGLGVPEWRLLLFWVVPSILSTFQLFFFGTYLPHRESEAGGWDDPVMRARSNAFPTWLSFLTCYHFGYHWEHHAYPHSPWWMLPSVRRRQLASERGHGTSHASGAH